MIIYAIFLFFMGVFYLFLAQKECKILGNNMLSIKFFILYSLFSIICFLTSLAYATSMNETFEKIYRIEFCIFLFSIVIIYRLVNLAINKNDVTRYVYILPCLLCTYFYYYADFKYGKTLIENSYIHFSSVIYYTFFILLIIFTFMRKEYNDYSFEKSLIKDTILFVVSLIVFTIYYLFEIKQDGVQPYDFAIIIYHIPVYYLKLIINKISLENTISSDAIQEVIENSNYIFVVTDSNFNIVYANEKCEEFIGKNIVGKSLKNILSECTISSENKDFIENFILVDDNYIEVLSKCTKLDANIMDSEKYLFTIETIRNVIESYEKLRMANRKLNKSINDEIKRLETRNYELEKNLKNKESLEYQIKDIFCYDTLTGLYNRSYFVQNMEETISESEKNMFHALMFLDLDGFKSINDSLGHSYGDDVIIEVANRLRKNYKYKNTIISRFGGDEFVILFRDVKDEKMVSTHANEILEIIKEPIYFDNAKIHLSTSIGIAMYPKDGLTTVDLLKSADTAMYESKENGKSQYKFFDDKFRWRIQNEYNITKDLISAVPNNELLLFYQPQVSVKGDVATVIGFESLMRWKKDGKLISPGIFIPVAEKTNIISEMGKWAIQEACEQCKVWNDLYDNKIKISINLSANQIMNPMLEDEVATALLTSGVDPACIELEITESAILKNIQHSVDKLNALKAYGVKISIDDFGTKYSTFNYLKRLPVDKIKIDISFVQSIGNNKIDEAIILSLIKLAKELGIDVIAEGVETQEQLEFLIKHGCNMIQGFYFFAPMPVDTVEEVVGKQNIFNIDNIFEYKKIEDELKVKEKI